MGEVRVNDEEQMWLGAGQVWHFRNQKFDEYYLLLRRLDGLVYDGLWECFDLLSGEIEYVLPCGAGDWELM